MELLLANGIPVDIVPGITAALGAAAAFGFPLTHREHAQSCVFVTGHLKDHSINLNWTALAQANQTIVIYMGIKTLPTITRKLIDYGRSPDTPVAVVRWASTPQQHSVVGTLATICDVVQQADIKPPALVIVGEVVKLRDTIDWFEKRALFGRRIVVTRTREQSSELTMQLEEHGAECLEYSTIHIEPVDDYTLLDQAIDRMGDYQWVLFTSLNAVSYFFQRLTLLGLDSRHLAGPKIAAVGKATAEELLRYGIRVDLIPEKFTGEGLAEALVQSQVAGSRILLPRALKAGDLLPETLTDAGATVTVAPVYRNVPPQGRKEELREQLESGTVDLVTFTSSSTVTNFLTMLDARDQDELHRLLNGVAIAAIGPVTAATLQEHGLHVDIQPRRYTIADMVRAIVAHYREQRATTTA